MPPLGIMSYGYGKEQADKIGDSFEQLFSETPIVISASGKDQMKVMDILEKGPEDIFEEKETKVIILLGFSQEQIQQALKGFPRQEDLPRPIFCTLTQQNIHWPLQQLLAHLIEEHNRRKA